MLSNSSKRSTPKRSTQPNDKPTKGSVPSPSKKLVDTVAAFTDQFLGPPRIPRGPKVIHDAIWGTQAVHENEVAILDTPLLQRLRQIHQTGFTYLTYPSVTHTRFDHTLGVMYQADRLGRVLQEKYADKDNTLISSQDIRRLRVAALLHDCSHGPFSHTSEDYYSTFPEIQEYIASKNGALEGASASEVLAYLIITSDPFKDFLNKLEASAALNLEAEWLASMITGQLTRSMSGHLN